MIAAGALHAAPVIYEPFAQTPGNLNGLAASTTGLTGNWIVNAGGVNVSSGSLAWGGLPVSGNRALAAGVVNGKTYASVGSALSTAGVLNHGAELGFSCIVRSVTGSAQSVIGNLNTAISRNSNFLLNVGPASYSVTRNPKPSEQTFRILESLKSKIRAV